MKEEMRTIGYLCPACHKRVVQQRSVFALSASGAVVSCECGESSLTIEAEENKFRLSVPCGVCGEEHLAECSADKLLHGRGIGLACPDTKMLCCFIGEDYAVEHEMEQLSLAAAKEREQGDDPRRLCRQRHHVRDPLRAQGDRRTQGRYHLLLRQQKLRHGDPQHLRRPCVQKLRREAAHPCGNG